MGAALTAFTMSFGVNYLEVSRHTAMVARSSVVAVLIYWLVSKHLSVRSLRHDAMTGLVRRNTAEERLTECADNRFDVTVALVDANNLKKVNDEFGHEAGDELLIELAKRLRYQFHKRKTHLVARFGGDEFIVIARKTSTQDLIEELTEVLSRSHVFGEWPLAAAGVARSRTGQREVLRCADKAMYRAKACWYASNTLAVLPYSVGLDGMLTVDKHRPQIRLRDTAKDVQMVAPVYEILTPEIMTPELRDR